MPVSAVPIIPVPVIPVPVIPVPVTPLLLMPMVVSPLRMLGVRARPGLVRVGPRVRMGVLHASVAVALATEQLITDNALLRHM
jgi:hypothetical protein